MKLLNILFFTFIFAVSRVTTSAHVGVNKCIGSVKPGYCYHVNEDDDGLFFYYAGCSSNQKCYPVNDGTDDEICQAEKKKIGATCTEDSECKSGKCASEKCAYVEAGQSCTSNSNCGTKAYCSSNLVCTNYLEENAECESALCLPIYMCANKSGKKICQKRFTIENGKETEDASLCKSGFSFKNTDQKKYCGTLKGVTECQSNICSYTVNDGSSSDKTLSAECSEDVCINKNKQKELSAYIEEYLKGFTLIEKNTEIKFSGVNEEHLSNMDVYKKYVNYAYKDDSEEVKQCMFDHFLYSADKVLYNSSVSTQSFSSVFYLIFFAFFLL